MPWYLSVSFCTRFDICFPLSGFDFEIYTRLALENEGRGRVNPNLFNANHMKEDRVEVSPAHGSALVIIAMAGKLK